MVDISIEHNTNLKTIKEYGYKEDQNKSVRQYMEDKHFIVDDVFNDGNIGIFAILDGHGGDRAVTFCQTQIEQKFRTLYKPDCVPLQMFTQLFKEVDEELLKQIDEAQEQGACVCVALVDKKNNKCHVVNLGDTRAVLSENKVSRRMTTDHKATNPDEVKRIKDQGGVIFRGRVSGNLAVTRALGDLALKQEGVTSEPDIQSFDINSNFEQYLIIASDGLWDVIDDDSAVAKIQNFKETHKMAEELINYALNNGSQDNTSVLILKF